MITSLKKGLLSALALGSLLGMEVSAASSTSRSQQMKITVGKTTFTATLDNGPAGQAFKALLPLSMKMTELNGNEKFADLPKALPTRANNPGTINKGDLLLYGSKTVVLFYETFQTSYSYTRLGRVNDPEGLAKALGTGNVTVTFALK